MRLRLEKAAKKNSHQRFRACLGLISLSFSFSIGCPAFAANHASSSSSLSRRKPLIQGHDCFAHGHVCGLSTAKRQTFWKDLAL